MVCFRPYRRIPHTVSIVCKVCESLNRANRLNLTFLQVSVFTVNFGSGGWDRTNDQLINSQLLYR